MADLPIGFAFSAGAVAAFNPCGFALLPAYLSVFLAGSEDRDATRGGTAGLGRAAVVATAVVAGFVLVFGVAGFLISQTAVTVQEYTPYISVVVGLALIPFGIAIVRGWTPKIRMPAVRRAGADGGVISMFWFGVSYATVSLSCTIPAFLVAVVGTFSNGTAIEGLAVFVAYTAGMASVLVVVTVAIATARWGMVGTLRRVLPYVNAAAGILAVLAGAYVAYYGWYEIQLMRGNEIPEGPITLVGDASGVVIRWVAGLGTAPVLIAVGVVVAAILALRLRHRSRTSGPTS